MMNRVLRHVFRPLYSTSLVSGVTVGLSILFRTAVTDDIGLKGGVLG